MSREATLGEATLAAAMAASSAGAIDILHNNVGVSIAGSGKPLEELTETAFDRVSAIDLRGLQACTDDHAAAAGKDNPQHFVGGGL